MSNVTVKRVTQKDVAALAGVSQVAVSAVLCGGSSSSHISEPLRQRIIEAAAKMNYQPNQSARALRTGVARSIAVNMLYINDPFYGQFLDHLARAARQGNYNITVHGASGPAGGVGKNLFQTPQDGIISVDSGVPEVGELHDNMQVPIVNITTQLVGEVRGDVVGIDLRSGAEQRMRYLLESGRKRIAILTDSGGISELDPRYATYRDAMSEAGLPPQVIEIPRVHAGDSYAGTREFIERNGAPEAILARNDVLAFAACRALHDLGLAIPEDVAIIGCDDLEICQYAYPRLSSMRLPVQEACLQAWRFMVNRLNEPGLAPQRIVLPSELVLRESC